MYNWLLREPGPNMILEALRLIGTKEQAGTGDNPEILAWAGETNLHQKYSNDETPWCGLFMAVVAKRAGKQYPEAPLWALNWATFGKKTSTAMLGDVLVFVRKDKNGRVMGGHVGLYVGHDKTAYHTLGGNQGNEVSIVRMPKERLVAVRRPIYNKQPANVRPIVLASTGALSKTEQ